MKYDDDRSLSGISRGIFSARQHYSILCFIARYLLCSSVCPSDRHTRGSVKAVEARIMKF